MRLDVKVRGFSSFRDIYHVGRSGEPPDGIPVPNAGHQEEEPGVARDGYGGHGHVEPD